MHSTLALRRFDETRQIIHEAQERKIDPAEFHLTLYAIAFLATDSAAMAEQEQWFAGKPDYENWKFALVSETETYAGHVGKSEGTDQTDGGLRHPSGQQRSGSDLP